MLLFHNEFVTQNEISKYEKAQSKPNNRGDDKKDVEVKSALSTEISCLGWHLLVSLLILQSSSCYLNQKAW